MMNASRLLSTWLAVLLPLNGLLWIALFDIATAIPAVASILSVLFLVVLASGAKDVEREQNPRVRGNHIIVSGGGLIYINGREYEGTNVAIREGKVFIDGKEQPRV